MRTILVFCWLGFSIGFFGAYVKPPKMSDIPRTLVYGLGAIVSTPILIGHDIADLIKSPQSSNQTDGKAP